MVKHFHIVEKKAALLLKHVGFEDSKVRGRDPNLLSDDEEVDEAALDVADQDEDKDNEEAFQLTLDYHGLIQIGDHGAQAAHSQQFEQAQNGYCLREVGLKRAACLCSCINDQPKEKRRRRYKISPKAIFQIVPGNFFGLLNCLSICRIYVSREEDYDHIQDEKDVDEDL